AGRAPTAQVGRQVVRCGQGGVDSALEPGRVEGQAQVAQEHRCGKGRRRGVHDAATGDVGGGAVHGLEVSEAVPVAPAGGHAQATYGRRGLVREDVAVEVGHHHHVEVPGGGHQPAGEGVDDVLLVIQLGVAGDHRGHG